MEKAHTPFLYGQEHNGSDQSDVTKLIINH